MSEEESSFPNSSKSRDGGDLHEENVPEDYRDLVLSLPRERGWLTPFLYQFQDFWFKAERLASIAYLQTHFHALDSDIYLLTLPKSGTTWLKALTFAILERKRIATISGSALLTSSSHDLVPFIDYLNFENRTLENDDDTPACPRLLSTHMPHSLLPESIKASSSRIVYICRNPFDVFISFWLFAVKSKPQMQNPGEQLSMDDAFDLFCRGVSPFGPFWDHILEGWKASQENPQKVLFLNYDELTQDTVCQVKKLADFVGVPFSEEEEQNGSIEDIVRLCSFDSMKEMSHNKTGNYSHFNIIENQSFFRKGKVGDWINYFTPEMTERLTKIMEAKFYGSGLRFSTTAECPVGEEGVSIPQK